MTAPVMPGAEPWSHAGDARGVLVLHGFTGNPQSMRPLAEALGAAGYSVELPLLPGHGTSVDDMLATRWSDWSGAAEAAYGQLVSRCEAVAAVGLSMGGTLACWLAERHPELRGIAVVNPLVEPDEAMVDGLEQLLQGGTERLPGIGSDIAKEGVAELAYDEVPVAAVLSLFEAAREVADRLGRITAPVLLLSSREDHVVPSGSGDRLEAGSGGPVERVWLERSYHVATLDHDAAVIASHVLDFAGRVLGPTR